MYWCCRQSAGLGGSMNIQWDAKGYGQNFGFVPQYGEDVVKLLNCPKDAFVVDLGCGNGRLTQKLADRGWEVLGVDASPAMLEEAKSRYPALRFVQQDACSFCLEKKADAVFSNAVFHWIDGQKQAQLLGNIAAQLKTGGELVCEFGGKGCAETVHGALEKSFARRGMVYPRTFYFPTIGEYAPLLEAAGFRVEYAVLFDRPTRQETQDGLRDWIHMFVRAPFDHVAESVREEIISEVQEEIRPRLFHDGSWYIDYVRIRFRAVKCS